MTMDWEGMMIFTKDQIRTLSYILSAHPDRSQKSKFKEVLRLLQLACVEIDENFSTNITWALSEYDWIDGNRPWNIWEGVLDLFIDDIGKLSWVVCKAQPTLGRLKSVEDLYEFILKRYLLPSDEIHIRNNDMPGWMIDELSADGTKSNSHEFWMALIKSIGRTRYNHLRKLL